MQTDNFNEFDRELRAMLEDVREEAPSRVWKAVESQLGHRQSPVFRWGYAALAVAAMAALALLLVLPDRPDSLSTIPERPVMLAEAEDTAASQICPVDTKDDTDGRIEMLAMSETSAETSTETSTEAATEAATEVVTGAVTEAAAEAVVDTPAPGQDEPAAPSSVTPSKIYSGPSGQVRIADEFSKMDLSESGNASGKRMTVDIRGALSSNDRTAGGFFPNARYATSGNVSSRVISESGESKYSVPVSFGVGARFYLSDRIALGSGLQYTYLHRSFQGTYSGESDLHIEHNMHYIGIPLDLSVDIVRSRLVDFYAFAGGAAEYAVNNNYNIHSSSGLINRNEAVKGIQWSAMAGVGLQFNVNDFMGIYMDPSMKYFFDCSQPKNVRTQKPFMFNFELGVRFKL